jgi:predicted MPP superfamily phosphohydrolase
MAGVLSGSWADLSLEVGVGTSIIPVRFGVSPEVVFLTVTRG